MQVIETEIIRAVVVAAFNTSLYLEMIICYFFLSTIHDSMNNVEELC